MADEYIAGTVVIDWTLSERDLGIAGIRDDIPPEQLRALYDRIEEAIAGAVSQTVDVYIDGEDKPPVRVCLDVVPDEIEITDGPVNGRLEDLRSEL